MRRRSTTTSRTFLTRREKTTLTTQPSIAAITNNSLPMNSKPITMPKTYECWRTSSGSDWNTISVKDVSPETPPPICSSTDSTGSFGRTICSPVSLNYFSRFSAESSSSSTPSKQCYITEWNDKNDSRIEVDDRSHYINRFGHQSFSSMQDNYSHGPEMNSNFLPPEYRGQPIISQSEVSDRGSPESRRHDLMTRPKPYSAYLDDVKKQEFDAEVESWKRAKEEDITDRLKRQEAVISEWEFRHASKATEDMKKFEKKLEKMRAKALEKLQKSLSMTKAEANKKVLKARRVATEKMSEVSRLSIKARATNNLSCLKL